MVNFIHLPLVDVNPSSKHRVYVKVDAAGNDYQISVADFVVVSSDDGVYPQLAQSRNLSMHLMIGNFRTCISMFNWANDIAIHFNRFLCSFSVYKV